MPNTLSGRRKHVKHIRVRSAKTTQCKPVIPPVLGVVAAGGTLESPVTVVRLPHQAGLRSLQSTRNSKTFNVLSFNMDLGI